METIMALKSKEMITKVTMTTGGNTSIAESSQPDLQNVIMG